MNVKTVGVHRIKKNLFDLLDKSRGQYKRLRLNYLVVFM